MRVIVPIPKQFEDSNGVPYANGKVTVYLHNSTSLAQIYKEAEGGTLAPNPTILDSHGAWNAFVNDGTAYDYVVQDEHDNVIFSYSNVKVSGNSGGGGSNEIAMFDLSQAENGLYNDIDASLGAGLLPIIYTGSQGAVRYYYYTARDSQAHTMTFTCGYNGKVELLTLHSDNTFEFSSSGTSDYIMAYGVNTFSASDAAAPLAQFSKQGDSLWIDGDGILHAKAGVYHVDYDSRVYIASGQDDVPEDAIRNMNPSVNYQDGTNDNVHEVDLSYRHAEHINKSFDIKLTQERTIAFSMQQAGGIVRYTLLGFNVFKIAEVQ